MFGEETKTSDEKENHHKRYLELKKDYFGFRDKALNAYDFYNLIEKSVLEMEEEDKHTVTEEELRVNGMVKEDMTKLCQSIRVLAM